MGERCFDRDANLVLANGVILQRYATVYIQVTYTIVLEIYATK